MPQEWKTLRVVVELPVRGAVTEKDLRYLVERLLDDPLVLKNFRVYPAGGKRADLGRLQVKHYNRHLAATKE